jgi:hypothetical protein
LPAEKTKKKAAAPAKPTAATSKKSLKKVSGATAKSAPKKKSKKKKPVKSKGVRAFGRVISELEKMETVLPDTIVKEIFKEAGKTPTGEIKERIKHIRSLKALRLLPDIIRLEASIIQIGQAILDAGCDPREYGEIVRSFTVLRTAILSDSGDKEQQPPVTVNVNSSMSSVHCSEMSEQARQELMTFRNRKDFHGTDTN